MGTKTVSEVADRLASLATTLIPERSHDMYLKNTNATVINTVAKRQGLTRLTAGLTRLPTGLRVKTHIKAGPTCTTCARY